MPRPRKLEDQLRDLVNQALKEGRHKLAKDLIEIMEREGNEKPDAERPV